MYPQIQRTVPGLEINLLPLKRDFFCILTHRVIKS